MATHVGNEGRVYNGSNQIAEVVEYTVTERAVAVDDSQLTDDWDTNLEGSKSWSAEVTCQWDETDTNGQEAMTIGDGFTFHFQPEGNDSGDIKLSGSGRVTEVGLPVRRNNTVQRRFSIQGNGILTHSTV